MKKRMRGFRLVVSGLVMLLVACGHQAPQIPSQRKGSAPKVDSTQLALMQMNQELAKAADEQLMQIALSQEQSYALYTGSAWVTILDHGDLSRPQAKPGEERVVHMRTYNLNGQLLEDSEGVYTIGKMELPWAVDANITEWHPGCRIRMYAPWYSAYGMMGTAHIPPYENIMIDIELK